MNLGRRKFCRDLSKSMLYLATGPAIVRATLDDMADTVRAQDVVPNRRRAMAGGGSAALVTSGLFAHYLSSDFDASTNGSLIGGWFSQEHPGPSAQQDEFQSANGDQPTVDGSTLCNGHKTVRFSGKACLACPNASGDSNGLYSKTTSTYPTGIEFFIVFQNDVDPPSGAALGNNSLGTPCTDNGAVLSVMATGAANTGWHAPFQDGNVYNGFGMSTRPNCGNPTTSTAGGWHCLNVSTPNPAGTRSLWIDSENFHTDTGYTFNTTNAGFTTVGNDSMLGGFGNGSGGSASFWGLKGNIAALFCYNRVLSSSERTQMRNYLNANWGTAI